MKYPLLRPDGGSPNSSNPSRELLKSINVRYNDKTFIDKSLGGVNAERRGHANAGRTISLQQMSLKLPTPHNNIHIMEKEMIKVDGDESKQQNWLKIVSYPPQWPLHKKICGRYKRIRIFDRAKTGITSTVIGINQLISLSSSNPTIQKILIEIGHADEEDVDYTVHAIAICRSAVDKRSK